MILKIRYRAGYGKQHNCLEIIYMTAVSDNVEEALKAVMPKTDISEITDAKTGKLLWKHPLWR